LTKGKNVEAVKSISLEMSKYQKYILEIIFKDKDNELEN